MRLVFLCTRALGSLTTWWPEASCVKYLLEDAFVEREASPVAAGVPISPTDMLAMTHIGFGGLLQHLTIQWKELRKRLQQNSGGGSSTNNSSMHIIGNGSMTVSAPPSSDPRNPIAINAPVESARSGPSTSESGCVGNVRVAVVSSRSITVNDASPATPTYRSDINVLFEDGFRPSRLAPLSIVSQQSAAAKLAGQQRVEAKTWKSVVLGGDKMNNSENK